MPDKYFLSKGAHLTAEEGRCAMEWVAYLAGESHSDGPSCVSPVLQMFCIELNDRMDDEDRQRLRPFLARTIGTRGDRFDRQRFEMIREAVLKSGWNVDGCACGVCRSMAIEALSVEEKLQLLDRLLPLELLQIPAVGVEEAAAVCGVSVS